VRTADTSGAGPQIQPTFQPVTLNVLPALPTTRMRSRMPGTVAREACRAPVKTRCSYTSSASTSSSCSIARAARTPSSARVKTLPVGLCGVLSSSSRARGVTAARSSAASKVHGPLPSAGGRRGTGRATPPAIAIPAA
jgi:hypothetical protein